MAQNDSLSTSSSSYRIRLHFLTAFGHTYMFDTLPTETIGSVKKDLSPLVNISVRHMLLKHNGRVLNDDNAKLACCLVIDGTPITIIVTQSLFH